MATYVALLRGINVGGNNIIKMVELRACFEQMGFSDVITYIQSGNVVFSARDRDVRKIEKKIQKTLKDTFDYTLPVVVLSQSELATVVKEKPREFGVHPETYRYDVVFLKHPLTARNALKQIRMREGVDTASAGKHAIYFSRLIAKASQSYLSKIVQSPIYKEVTIRNWNTTTKLLALSARD